MIELGRATADEAAEPPAAGAAGALSASRRPARLSLLAAMLGSRLCQRVALAIFLCLLAVATIFLIPAYRDLERSLLTRAEQSALASVGALFRLAPGSAAPAELVAAAG